MNIITALALFIGVLGGIATWLLGGPLSGTGLQIWVLFIGWASFFSAGGTVDGMTKSVAGNVWGVLWGVIAFAAISLLGLSSPALVGVVVCVTAILLVLGAYAPILSVIPAAFYGYASVAGFMILKSASALDSNPTTSPFVVVCLSLIIGNIFGFVSGKLANMVAKP